MDNLRRGKKKKKRGKARGIVVCESHPLGRELLSDHFLGGGGGEGDKHLQLILEASWAFLL